MRAQARQAARLADGRKKDLFLELDVIVADHRDLQLLARAEVGEDARLAHAGDLGQQRRSTGPRGPCCAASASAASMIVARVCRPFSSGRGGAGSARPSAAVSSAWSERIHWRRASAEASEIERSCYFAGRRRRRQPASGRLNRARFVRLSVRGRRMKIAVVGLGAVGGLIAARLARAGHEVSALARGETLGARPRRRPAASSSARGSFSVPLARRATMPPRSARRSSSSSPSRRRRSPRSPPSIAPLLGADDGRSCRR